MLVSNLLISNYDTKYLYSWPWNKSKTCFLSVRLIYHIQVLISGLKIWFSNQAILPFITPFSIFSQNFIQLISLELYSLLYFCRFWALSQKFFFTNCIICSLNICFSCWHEWDGWTGAGQAKACTILLWLFWNNFYCCLPFLTLATQQSGLSAFMWHEHRQGQFYIWKHFLINHVGYWSSILYILTCIHKSF